MIDSREFVERKKKEYEDEILNLKTRLEEYTRMVIKDGYYQYDQEGRINFRYFINAVSALKEKFDEVSVNAAVPDLKEAIDSIANPNGWQLDADAMSFEPINDFKHHEKTVLPTPDDFENQIFIDKAREVYNTFILGMQLLEKAIGEGYQQFRQKGWISIDIYEGNDFSNFLRKLEKMDEELRNEVWNVMEENLNRSGWHLEKFMSNNYKYCKIVPIEHKV